MSTWRLTLHERPYTAAPWEETLIAELTDARSRQLTQELNKAAQLTFTMDGRAPAAALIQELAHEVIAWRDAVPYFRGIVGQAEDELTEQSHVTVFTCHDYVAMLARRYLTAPLDYENVAQDDIVAGLVGVASGMHTSSGTSLAPGSWLPLTVTPVNQDGTPRAAGTSPVRVRQYAGQSVIGDLVDQLAHVINGFDYDARPAWADAGGGTTTDHLRVFYPYQGIDRTGPGDVVLEYGGALAALTRSVTSADYGNYVRVIGNNASSDPLAPQLYAEDWNADANNVGQVPVGLWQNIDSGADVTDVTTLAQQAAGDLNLSGVLIPSYSATLREGTYREGIFNMGDSVPLVVKSGRLDVSGSLVRIIGLVFDITDDGAENVGLTLGRPLNTLVDMMRGTEADVNALLRR